MSGYLTLSFAGWERWVHVGTDDLWKYIPPPQIF
jgi:hypothetical protein